jgi:hypothetical protein
MEMIRLGARAPLARGRGVTGLLDLIGCDGTSERPADPYAADRHGRRAVVTSTAHGEFWALRALPPTE